MVHNRETFSCVSGKITFMSISKRAVTLAFESPRSPYFVYINDILAFATVVSIFAIIIETVPSFASYAPVFSFIEWATVVLFTLEYIVRLWVADSPKKYALSFFGIVDLVAVLPTFLGLGNLTFLKSARVVRIIRFLRLVRLTKLSRLSMKDAEETMGIFGFNIALYATTLVFVMLMFGVALHVFNTPAGQYWSVPQGMYWTFSLFLGGLPAPVPPGTSGTIIFILAKFCGMALFGLLVGVVGKLFNEWILGKK